MRVEILKDSRREALFTAVMWVTCFLWTVGYCAAFGYRQDGAPRLIQGIPDWVVYGILAPWTFATVVTLWFALWGMKDADLGEDHATSGEGEHG